MIEIARFIVVGCQLLVLRRDRLEDDLEAALEVEAERQLLVDRRAGNGERGHAGERQQRSAPTGSDVAPVRHAESRDRLAVVGGKPGSSGYAPPARARPALPRRSSSGSSRGDAGDRAPGEADDRSPARARPTTSSSIDRHVPWRPPAVMISSPTRRLSSICACACLALALRADMNSQTTPKSRTSGAGSRCSRAISRAVCSLASAARPCTRLKLAPLDRRARAGRRGRAGSADYAGSAAGGRAAPAGSRGGGCRRARSACRRGRRSPRRAGAGRARSGRCARLRRPLPGERRAGARGARRQDAVEHVDAARDHLEDALRVADAHEVARPVGREQRRGPGGRVEHRVARARRREPAERVAVEAERDDLLDRAAAAARGRGRPA